jgi:hypothetical protein
MCALVTVHCCSPTGDQHSRTHHATTQPRWVPCDLKTQARTHAHTCTHIRVWERRTLCWSLTTWTSSLPQSSYMHACTHAHTHTHVHTQTGAGKTYTVLGPHDLDLLSATIIIHARTHTCTHADGCRQDVHHAGASRPGPPLCHRPRNYGP